jgi:hypothetical protein
MRMHRGSWLTASASHLAILSTRNDGITECNELESMSLELKNASLEKLPVA